MKTIYGLYWKHVELGEEIMVSTTWLDEREQADIIFDQLTIEKAQGIVMFSFEVEDDADDDDINALMDDFVAGQIHLADLGATVLQ